MNPSPPAQDPAVKKLVLESVIAIPLFDELDSNEINLIAGYMELRSLSDGQIVFREGDKGDYVCFVAEGTLDIVKESAEGKPVVIASLSKGRSLGEMALIDEFPRSATVRARSKARLITLGKPGFEMILQRQPQIGIKILKSMARLLSLNLRKTSGRLADSMPGT